MGDRLSFFLAAWQQITSDNPRGGQPGLFPPVCEAPPLLETMLPRLLSKQQALWEEVASLLKKWAVETVDLSQDQGGILFPSFPGYQMHRWFPPHPKPQGIEHVSSCFQIPYGDLNSSRSPSGLMDGITGFERCISACTD